jgi:protein-S-isoprenylcysteine O-methyltransferase Ste14
MLSGLGLFDQLLFVIPLWLAGVILIVVCILAREAGAWLYRRIEREGDDDDDSTPSHIIGSIFGLLAFVIAFCFSIALDRFDNRRSLVAEEANAIQTTYLRASLFEEPDHAKIQATLRQYAATRIAPNGLWDKRMDRRLAYTRSLRVELWDETRVALWPMRQTEQASYFLEPMNHMFEVATRRELAARARIPTRILDVMLLYLFASSIMLGYVLQGRKGGNRKASAVMLALFVVVIVLVLDIDRPQSGSITVPQRAMEELVTALDRDAVRNPPVLVTPVEAP